MSSIEDNNPEDSHFISQLTCHTKYAYVYELNTQQPNQYPREKDNDLMWFLNSGNKMNSWVMELHSNFSFTLVNLPWIHRNFWPSTLSWSLGVSWRWLLQRRSGALSLHCFSPFYLHWFIAPIIPWARPISSLLSVVPVKPIHRPGNNLPIHKQIPWFKPKW